MSIPQLAPRTSGGPYPRVSVVMPTYNRADLMRISVEMLLQQTLQDFELIIVDDQSTDHTAQVAAELAAADRRVTYHCLPEKGFVAGAMNAGIVLSRGDYIQICHDHDLYLPEMLARLADVLDRHPSVVYVHPGLQNCDFKGNRLRHDDRVAAYPEVSDGPRWLRMMLARHDSPVPALSMIRRTALEQMGLFDPAFGITTDVEMWMRLAAVGDVGYVNELLLLVRERDPDHPYSGNWQIQHEILAAHRKHLRVAYRGVGYAYHRLLYAMQSDVRLLTIYLNGFRHRNWPMVRNGRVFLRQHGVFLSRAAAWIL